MPILPDKYNCTGCLACVDTCSKDALKAVVNTEGHFIYSLDKEKCIECHKCERVCPALKEEGDYGKNDLTQSTPYAAWCTITSLRARSTSGGVFASFAYHVLNHGGVIVGAALLNNKVRHIAIEKVADLSLLQGSKYAQSDTHGIYEQVLSYLKDGKRVLFSGTGCQISALYNFLPKTLNIDGLITLDLVCGGVPSNYLIERYLSENVSVQNINGFRKKESYNFSIVDKQGVKKDIPLSERPLPLCGFYWEMTNRYCCYDCHYAYTHRKADLTIGDLWGDKSYIEQHKDGISLVIVHSPKGLKALEEAEVEVHEVKWADVLPYNPRIAYGKNIMGKTRERKRLSTAFKNDSYQKLLDNYANDASFKRPWSIIKKLYRVLLITINHKITVRHINRLLKG